MKTFIAKIWKAKMVDRATCALICSDGSGKPVKKHRMACPFGFDKYFSKEYKEKMKLIVNRRKYNRLQDKTSI